MAFDTADIGKIGTDLSQVGSVLSGVSSSTNGAPGGSIATDEQGNFSLDRLAGTLQQVGGFLSKFGAQEAPPASGNAPILPSGTPASKPFNWVPVVAIGAASLLLIVVLFRK